MELALFLFLYIYTTIVVQISLHATAQKLGFRRKISLRTLKNKNKFLFRFRRKLRENYKNATHFKNKFELS